VDLRPEATALQMGDRALSYAQLDAQANALARSLIEHGLQPGQTVGLCMGRCLEMGVALLAVLKAGGAYLMLDPAQPTERLQFMLQDCRATLVLCVDPWTSTARSLQVCPLLEISHELLQRRAPRPALALPPGALLCVMYTSGSTGLPKGVRIPHRAVPGFFWEVPELGFDPQVVTLQYASTAWDALTLELWTALLSGGRCVLYDAPQVDVQEIVRLVQAHGVNTLWMTSTFFNAVVDSGLGWLQALRTLLIGGEAISLSHARRVVQALPGLRLVNGYGPCECTVFASCQPLDAALLAQPGPRGVPIGRPVGDRSVFVMDARLQPLPLGAVGELCIGGDSLADGYIAQPALTAQRFVPHPWLPGQRLRRPRRRPGQAAGLSHRAGRGRARAARSARCGRGRRDGARGSARRSASGGLSRPPRDLAAR
jgi:amino acid adenylation domain-containing protein